MNMHNVYMYGCVFICLIHVCIYIYMWMCTKTQDVSNKNHIGETRICIMYICMVAFVYVSYMCVHVFVYVGCVSVYMGVYIYVYICLCVFVCIHHVDVYLYMV